jgi:hypothetical protein
MVAQLRFLATDALLRWPLRWNDRRRNAAASAQGRILVAHSAVERPDGFRDFLRWTAAKLPQLRQRFEFRLLPCPPLDMSRYAAVVFWGGATLVERAPWLYRAALDLTGRAWAAGVPLVNPADLWANAVPSRAARLIAAAGLWTPRIYELNNLGDLLRRPDGSTLPLRVRDDDCRPHRSEPIRSADDIAAIRWRFRRPIAVESIDTGSAIGRWRRTYQYLAVGEVGLSRRLNVERIGGPLPAKFQRAIAGVYEAEFVATPNPHYAAFQEARRRLGFDLVAFDYAYDRAGQLMVLRADPFPDLNYSRDPSLRHTIPVVERAFAALARLYLERAGLAEPLLIEEILAETPSNSRATSQLRIAAAA